MHLPSRGVGIGRQPPFFGDDDYAAYIEWMADHGRDEGVAIWAYGRIAGCPTTSNLLEDIDDLAVAAERVDERTIPHADAMAELRKDGYLPD